MRLVMLAAAGCLGLIAPAVAQDSNGNAAAPVAKEKKICRNAVNTGSIMKTRVCHTREEWKQIERQNAQSTDQFSDRLRRGSIGTVGDN